MKKYDFSDDLPSICIIPKDTSVVVVVRLVS